MNRNLLETLMGAFVFFIAVGFGFFAYKSSNIATPNGYELIAKFDSIDGLANGGDVRIGGVKVGAVIEQTLDTETYMAIVKLSLSDTIKIPKDSSVSIVSSGLLGGKYVSITPGGDEEYLKNNGEIEYTQSSVNFESLIGKMMFSGGGVDKDEPKEDK